MTKKRRSGRGRRGGRGGNSRRTSVRVPFSGLVSVALVAAAANVNVAPTAAGLNIPRLTTVSDPFQKYRFTSFRFRVIQNGSGVLATDQCACYLGKTQATNPINNLAEMMETGCFSLLSSGNTVNGNWASVPKSILRGMLTWYQTQGGNAASDTEEDNQGTLYLIGAGTNQFHLEVKGVIELDVPSDIANTPQSVQTLERKLESIQTQLSNAQAQRERELEEERAKLVRLFPALSHLVPAKRVDSCKTG